MNTTQAGSLAENAVARELAKDGYRIVAQNWKNKYAEIDIVAVKDAILYFVEVKYRKTDFAGDGFDYITANKLHRMQRAAEAYVRTSNWPGEYILLAASAIGELENLQIEIVEV